VTVVDQCPPQGIVRPDLTDDPLGAECIAVRDRIRAQFRAARSVVALWEPRPVLFERRPR